MNDSLICAKNLMVEFPTYIADRSLKRILLNAATGGKISRDAKSHVLVRAIDGISFDLKPGDRIGLMGHNGSGKTTLLRVLAGAYAPVSGQLEIRGLVSSLLDISMGMSGDATGYENIILRGLMMGLEPEDIRNRLHEIGEFTELGDYLTMPIRTYSSGMKLRLAFAVSTAIPADILLMDEWLSVGDDSFKKKASKRMDSLVEKAAILVIASHSKGLISRMCNRVFMLEHGRVIDEINPSCLS